MKPMYSTSWCHMVTVRSIQDHDKKFLHRVSIHHWGAAGQSWSKCVSLQWVVGRLSADKSMSHSLCLVRPNMPEADHCLPAYKLKHIAFSMLYYLFCCWVLFQTSHWEVVLISLRLMLGASTSLACFKLRMSNDHRHEFMGSAANEWSLIHCLSVFAMLLFPFQSNTFVYHQRIGHCICVCHLLKRLKKKWLTPWILPKSVFFVFLCFSS